MSEQLLTVEFAAQRLKLHPKTVLRFIRDGRLAATRVGKSYRIRRSDVDAFGGLPERGSAAADASVTAIVDVPDCTPVLAKKLAQAVPAALQGKRSQTLLRADVVYDPARAHLKFVVVGTPGDTSNLLGLIQVWLEQMTP